MRRASRAAASSPRTPSRSVSESAAAEQTVGKLVGSASVVVWAPKASIIRHGIRLKTLDSFELS